MINAQTEDLGCVAGLDAVAFALSRIASNDSEVRAGDGENGATVVGVGVEGPLLGLGERTVRHCV